MDVKILQKILPGLIALVILAVYWGPSEFYPWLFETLIFYAGYFFLLRVVVLTIINRKFNPEHLRPMLIGALAIVVSIVLLIQTPEDIVINLLKATIIFSIIYASFEYIRKKIE